MLPLVERELFEVKENIVDRYGFALLQPFTGVGRLKKKNEEEEEKNRDFYTP